MRSVLAVEEGTAARRRKRNAAYDLENDAAGVTSRGVASAHGRCLYRQDKGYDARAGRKSEEKIEWKWCEKREWEWCKKRSWKWCELASNER